ncbi:PREDICTED: peroxidase-like [Papilio polytes]|uniref:peroxidase-like n=1 Tax=Papilio polytes TaxID=76194 RepID=UPI00067667F8|nr:PREDICTED: peroxidase-like [Papilio polytes]
MNRLVYTLILISIDYTECLQYDRFSGETVDGERLKELRLSNATSICTIYIKPCVPHEGSRIDGTCNNYKYPSLGAAKGPYARLLKPDYAENGDVRLSKNGKPLPSARQVRTFLQSTGRVTDKITFNVAAVHYLDFINRDVSVLFEPIDYLTKGKDCCHQTEAKDPRCMPIEVPDNDPYLKVTDIRCLNFSRAETFQDIGCLSETMLPEHINLQTPLIDLSTIYGVDERSMNLVRKWENGLLLMEERKGRNVPLVNLTKKLCIQNVGNETNCYTFGFPEVGNFDLRTTSFTIFFMREHNRIAKILHELNPCWKDDRLFKVARQINVATATNIFLYELLPLLLDRRNMISYGLISNRKSQVSAYDETAIPLVFAEYEIATRFFHTLIDGRIKKYDKNYNYVDELTYSDSLFRQDLLEQNGNFEEINRGTFYQNAAKMDDIQDPEISERYFGNLQKAYDQTASDIQRSRDLGMRGYNEYRNICGLKTAKTFEDFADVIDIEKVELLKHLYEDVDDVDLLAGIMSENYIKNTFVGPTLFCIMARQMNVYRFGDRYWFERGDQYHSFTPRQLQEIKKTNLARLACDNAEGIKYIQPQAFLNVQTYNAPVSCSRIPGADLTSWYDKNCYKTEDKSIEFGREKSNEFYIHVT